MRQARLGAALGLYQVTVLSRWKPSSCMAKPTEKMTCCVPETQRVPEGLRTRRTGLQPPRWKAWSASHAARLRPSRPCRPDAPAAPGRWCRRSTGGREGRRRSGRPTGAAASRGPRCCSRGPCAQPGPRSSVPGRSSQSCRFEPSRHCDAWYGRYRSCPFFDPPGVIRDVRRETRRPEPLRGAHPPLVLPLASGSPSWSASGSSGSTGMLTESAVGAIVAVLVPLVLGLMVLRPALSAVGRPAHPGAARRRRRSSPSWSRPSRPTRRSTPASPTLVAELTPRRRRRSAVPPGSGRQGPAPRLHPPRRGGRAGGGVPAGRLRRSRSTGELRRTTGFARVGRGGSTKVTHDHDSDWFEAKLPGRARRRSGSSGSRGSPRRRSGSSCTGTGSRTAWPGSSRSSRWRSPPPARSAAAATPGPPSPPASRSASAWW